MQRGGLQRREGAGAVGIGVAVGKIGRAVLFDEAAPAGEQL